MKIRTIVFVVGLLSLNACTFSQFPVLPQGMVYPQQRIHQGFFQSALLKRPLFLKEEYGFRTPVACLACQMPTGFSIQQVMMTKPAIAPAYFYGGHDFNQYVIQYAEENIYPASKGNDLLEVFQESVQPLLKEWDPEARLIESRAMVNSLEPEYIQLPGRRGEPLKVMPRYVYRLASTPLKQTLNVYVLEDEIRVHRMVWGENQIDISRVKIDSDQAIALARKAVASTVKDPGYPVYPSATEIQNPGMKVIYELPEDLVWQIHLTQQEGRQLRYFISFFHGQGGGGGIAMPVPLNAVADSTPAKGFSEVSRSGDALATETSVSILPAPMPKPIMSWSGSLEIDAVSGQILALNRPVIYYPTAASGSGGGSIDGAAGVAVTEPILISTTH